MPQPAPRSVHSSIHHPAIHLFVRAMGTTVIQTLPYTLGYTGVQCVTPFCSPDVHIFMRKQNIKKETNITTIDSQMKTSSLKRIKVVKVIMTK
jgi:hypothetical protein